jgi:6-pyruvoyltetrahydropterin/6-carboxytetrahydropterin synthase
MTKAPVKHTLLVRKEALKFASAHMTVFADGSKEALHGHNYTTEARAQVVGIGVSDMVDFSVLKDALAETCRRWDEKTLLPKQCPFLKTSAMGPETEFTLCGKRYVLPTDEVEWVDCDNVTTENLAAVLLEKVRASLDAKKQLSRILSLEIRVYESPGQGASCRWKP